ncbi:MAG: hypothetical protein IIB35_01465 [Gemmatimonadetes bacterium]|nr:hypothetical protein [Gemmatimonadota bacterium]
MSRKLGTDCTSTDCNSTATRRPLAGGSCHIGPASHSYLWQRTDSCGTRWLLENYEFDFTTVTDADLRTGDLSGFDAIVLPDQDAARILTGHLTGTMPEQYTGGIGAEGTASLKRFVERGGTLIALDHAAD